MPLIELIGVAKDWGLDPIFSDVSLKIEEGEKVGLVGANGSGKTSLMRIIAGLDDDFRGTIRRRPGLVAALVPQRYEPPAGKSCVEVLLEPAVLLEEALEVAAAAMAGGGPEAAAALGRYGELAARYEALGGEGAEEAARRILARAGLGPTADAPAASLSGGEKNVLALALALASAPDLLLLDEPGNHLDFAGLAWLEEFARGERRAILTVSHNRSLLDAAVDRIVELESGRATAYAGGYSAYRVEKLARRAGQGREWQADRKRIERLEALVARFAQIAASRPDPACGKRLRARRSQLERLRDGAAERPSDDGRRMAVSFAGGESRSDYALVVRGYRKAYGGRSLFEGAGFDLLAGERAAIVGPNGSGKTSFLRDLVERAAAPPETRWAVDEPIRVGPSMRLGYCAQEQELLDPGRTVGEELEALGARPEEAFRLLRRYLFDRSVLDTAVASLSGGERNRLQIARAVFLGANFLVLDEPTNHLDIESREALQEALADFGGTVLLVSHDRWFLEKVAERLILVEGCRFAPYEGSFAEYWRDAGRPRAEGARGGPVGLEGRRGALSRVSRTRGSLAQGSREQGSRAPSSGEAEARKAGLERRITELELEREALEKASARASSERDFAAAGRSAAKARAASSTLERLWKELESIS